MGARKERKTTSYQAAPAVPRPKPGRKEDDFGSLHLERLPEDLRPQVEMAWTLATEYHARGRQAEAVEYYLLSAALLEGHGIAAEPIYRTVIRIQPDNDLARSRLGGQNRPGLLAEHILRHHDLSALARLLEAERARNWATPPRGSQNTCPDCGMGIPAGTATCPMCCATLTPAYEKRATAGYSLDAIRRSAEHEAVDVAAGPTAIPAARRAPLDERSRPSHAARVVLLTPDGAEVTRLEATPRGLAGHQESGPAREVRLAVDIRFAEGRFRVLPIQQGRVFLVLRDASLRQARPVVQIGHRLLRIEALPKGLLVAFLAGDWSEETRIRLPVDAITVGRSGQTVDLPSDPYVTERHMEAKREEGQVLVRDLGSRSGTFVAVQDAAELEGGAILRIGSIFLRLEP